ncbi:MAG: hypothetical protein ABIR17_11960 [Pseudolysinimonas sp.]|uniref:hypothetical protein n=1 Tax=Pseudolysinimonas sp. TaxID=2680009 RepID=UPI003265A0C9
MTDHAVPAKPVKGATSADERPKPNTLAELFESAYASTGRLGLAARDVEALSRGVLEPSVAEEAEMRVIREHAARDIQLRGLVNALQPIAEHRRKGKDSLRDRAGELGVEALSQHPVFEGWAAALRDPESGVRVSAAAVWDRAKLVSSDLQSPDSTAPLSEAAVERLQANSVTALALVRIVRGDWDLAEFIAQLSGTIWRAPALADARDTVIAGVLTGPGRPEPLAALARALGRAADQARAALGKSQQDAAFSTRRALTAEARGAQLEAEAQALEDRIRALVSELEGTRTQVKAEREAGSVARSHHADDYEALRTRVVRQLTKQADLLGDGLHALRNDSLRVADEFVDRALAAIIREVSELKDMEG